LQTLVIIGVITCIIGAQQGDWYLPITVLFSYMLHLVLPRTRLALWNTPNRGWRSAPELDLACGHDPRLFRS